MRQKDLADHIGVEGNSLVRIIDELEGEGLVLRRDDPTDRRAKLVDLTASGRRAAVELEQVHRGFIVEMLSGSEHGEILKAISVLSSVIDKANSRSDSDTR